MKTQIEVNGIKLPDETQVVLKRWQDQSDEIESTPERYICYLNDTQDYLIRLMQLDSLETNLVTDLLTKLISIKDDLKLFVLKEGSEL